MSEAPRVTMATLRKLRWCARGVRHWCAQHGIDYARLVRDGLPVEEVARVDDEFARRAVTAAMSEAEAING